MPKTRPAIESITVKLVDGRSLVIQGEGLADPLGGCLFWNNFGALEVLKDYYQDVKKEPGKAQKTQELWEGTAEENLANPELPAVMTKPVCSPTSWP